MKFLHASTKPIPAWQMERADRLHRICQFIKARRARGLSRLKAVHIFSRRWSGRPLKSDPAKKYALNIGTLYRHYRTWQLAGETPAAFQLHYTGCARRIPAPVLVRFVNFIADRDFPSFSIAWTQFCLRGGNYGPGRVRGQRLDLTHDSLKWNLPRRCWSEFKLCHKALREARQEIEALRERCINDIRARVPERLPRRTDFEI